MSNENSQISNDALLKSYMELLTKKMDVNIEKIVLSVEYYNITPQIYNKITDLIFEINNEHKKNINFYINRMDKITTESDVLRYVQNEYDKNSSVENEFNKIVCLSRFKLLESHKMFKHTYLRNIEGFIDYISSIYQEQKSPYKKIQSFIETAKEIDYNPFTFDRVIPPTEVHIVNISDFSRISDVKSILLRYKQNIEQNIDNNVARVYIPTLGKNNVIYYSGTNVEIESIDNY